MSFCGYRYRFGLYAAHSNLMNIEEKVHYHNFTITLYVKTRNNKSDDNFHVEKAVNDWIKPFQGQHLTNTTLFNGKETTIENMGDTFFEPLFEVIENLEFELVKLDIYENPIRVYSVSKKRLDSTVNEINTIPFECLPLIHIQDERDLLDEENEEFKKEVAATLEHFDECMTIDSSQEASYESTINNMGNNVIVYKPNKVLLALKLLFGFFCISLLAFITMYIVKMSGMYPQGSDTFCHLYRADLLLKNIMQGNWFPLYDSKWYNGVEIMRYWGPIPLYMIAGLEGIAKSGVLDAYVLFLGFLVFVSGCGWLLWGYRYNRVGLSIVLGLVWFYIPENMRVVIQEGNLPRGVINALLPFFFYFLWRLMVDRKKNALWSLMIVTSLITLCHLGITIMLLVTAAIFITIYSKMNHCIKWSLCALGTCISGVMLAGLWVVPALIGGAASSSSTNQVMKNFFESAFVSLNPIYRLNGDVLSFYFGLSIFIICMVGILFGTKKVLPGFITALILFLCTTKSTYALFSKLPFSQFLWMIRFIPIGLATAMVSFIMWKQLRKGMVLLLSILLIADCVTSIQYIYFPKEDRIANVQAVLDKKADNMLLTDAKEITNQRMAVLDLSKYGAFAPYYITGVGKSVNYTFGAGWEGASTATNIVNLNAAVEFGWYIYLFDRALELGNDTVLIPIENLKEKSKDVELVVDSAEKCGYYLVEDNGSSLLFHKDTVKQFGVITEYKNIAIGDSASGIAMIFPSFEEGSNNNINDYTFEELCNYKTIYLSGFTYQNKTAAENLLLKLSESGVNVYIDMNKVPMNKVKKQMELFGVNAQSIAFTETYPEFKYNGETYQSLDYSADIGVWNTIYLDGLEDVKGYCHTQQKDIPFIGTVKNENLHFIGMNIVYYLQTTRDSEVRKLIESAFSIDGNTSPYRKVIPISIEAEKDKIKITSSYDNLNTTLSSMDIFHSKKEVKTNNNLIFVNSGTTIININYPYIIQGIFVTLVGVIFAIFIYVLILRMKEKDENEKKKCS